MHMHIRVFNYMIVYYFYTESQPHSVYRIDLLLGSLRIGLLRRFVRMTLDSFVAEIRICLVSETRVQEERG